MKEYGCFSIPTLQIAIKVFLVAYAHMELFKAGDLGDIAPFLE